MGKITINDIARLTGLSKGTVDRVLHNRGEVSAKTREKVLAVIKEQGYQPNLYASMLASSQERSIGILLPSPDKGSYWELAASGIGKASAGIASLGLQVKEYLYNQYSEESFHEACTRLLEAPPEGVVLTSLFKTETQLFTEELQARGIPYVFVDTKPEMPGYLAYYGLPAYKSGYLCADILTGGEPVREVLVVRVTRDKGKQSDPTVMRRAGFSDYIQEHFPACTVRSLFIDPSDPQATDDALDAFFTEFPGVRHIVMFNSRIHLIVPYLERHPAARRRVVGFDNLSANLSALRRGSVSMIIAQHPDEQVSQAIRALTDYIVFQRKPESTDNFMHMDILMRYNIDNY